MRDLAVVTAIVGGRSANRRSNGAPTSRSRLRAVACSLRSCLVTVAACGPVRGLKVGVRQFQLKQHRDPSPVRQRRAEWP